MAYSQTINLVVGDTLPELALVLRDSNKAADGQVLDPENTNTWAAVNITNATVRLRIREVGATTIASTLTMVIQDGEGGQASTDFPDGTLNAAGLFEGEVEITYSNGSKMTVPDLLKLKVRDDFD